MSNHPAPIGKINSGLNGLGVPTPELVDERARQLAKVDGRSEPNEADRLLALGELQGTVPPQSPEVSPELESVTEWDTPVETSGKRVAAAVPEDEANIGESLVEEGMEEADHELRVAASEENPSDE